MDGYTRGFSSAVKLSSDKDTHFSGALATNAGEDENLTGLKNDAILITGITVVSDQNLDWDVQFYSTDGFDDTDLDLDTFLGAFKFVAADGDQVAATGPYKYSTSSSSNRFIGIDYVDVDATKELHVKLVNRNATSKNAGATGEVVLTFTYLPY